MIPGQRVSRKAKEQGKVSLNIPGMSWNVSQNSLVCVHNLHLNSMLLISGIASSGLASYMTSVRQLAAFRRCYVMVNAGVTATRSSHLHFSTGSRHLCQRLNKNGYWLQLFPTTGMQTK